MTRYLLASCAAAALAAGCGSAYAADATPVTAASGAHIMINGDAYFEGAYVTGENNSGNRSIDFANRFRLNIIPDFKADNGLEYGARLRLRNGGSGSSETTSANIDRAYIFVKGMFGEVDLGQDVGPDYNVGYYAPNTVGTGFGIDGDWSHFAPSNHVTTTYLFDAVGLSANRESKIVYYTPVFAGFQLAGSYTPQAKSSGYSPNLSANTATTGPLGSGNGQFQDIYEVDVIYKGTFGPVGIGANAAYSGGRAGDNQFVSEPTHDLKSVKGGMQISYGGFIVGGEYINSFDSGYAKTLAHKVDQQVFDIGGQYTTGPFVLAASYARGLDAGQSAGSGVSAGRHLNLYSAGVDYHEAPGLTTGVEWDYYNGKADAGTTGDHGNIVIVTQKVAF